VIYVVEEGEYSDFSWIAVMEGPDDVDVDAAHAEAKSQVDTCFRLPAAFIKALEKRGCRELPSTRLHIGQTYGRSQNQKLTVERPASRERLEPAEEQG
jgi:hypothetical protein